MLDILLIKPEASAYASLKNLLAPARRQRQVVQPSKPRTPAGRSHAGREAGRCRDGAETGAAARSPCHQAGRGGPQRSSGRCD